MLICPACFGSGSLTPADEACDAQKPCESPGLREKHEDTVGVWGLGPRELENMKILQGHRELEGDVGVWGLEFYRCL